MNPRIRQGYIVARSGESEAIAQRGSRLVRIEAEPHYIDLLLKLIPWLDGRSTVEQLYEEITRDVPSVTSSEVEQTVRMLQDYRLLALEPTANAGIDGRTYSHLNLLESLGIDSVGLSERLSRQTVLVSAPSHWYRALSQCLGRLGVMNVVRASEALRTSCDSTPSALIGLDPPPAVFVLVQDVEDLAREESANRDAVASDISYLPVLVQGLEVRVGPFVIPKATACLACHFARSLGTTEHHREYLAVRAERLRRSFPKPDELFMPVIPFASSVVSIEVWKYLAADFISVDPISLGAVLRVDLLTFQGSVQPVLKLPRCEVCGTPALDRPTVRPWMEAYCNGVDRH